MQEQHILKPYFVLKSTNTAKTICHLDKLHVANEISRYLLNKQRFDLEQKQTNNLE